mgnify:CR=1 FL=1
MKLLGREDILAADDTRTVDVEVPEWGGVVRLRVMTGAARQAFLRAASKRAGDDDGLVEALIVACAVDEHGQRIFSPDDVPALREKSGAALQRVFAAAAELNGLTDDAVDRLAGE